MTKIKKFSIVPDMIKAKGIKFYDEKDLPIFLSEPLEGNSDIPRFQPPFLWIDTFAIKTTRPPNIKVTQDMNELRELGFIICSVRAPGLWFRGQQVALKLSRKDNPIAGSKILKHIPPYHKCEIDINNKIIRLCGANAGANRYGPWLNLDIEKPEKSPWRSIRPPKQGRFGQYL